jgi:hypothetical protein
MYYEMLSMPDVTVHISHGVAFLRNLTYECNRLHIECVIMYFYYSVLYTQIFAHQRSVCFEMTSRST